MLLLFSPVFCFALNNPVGTSDPSSAELDASITIPTMFRISGISDLAFGTYSGSGSMSMDDDVCVWTNTTGGEYQVTAKGDGASFAFVVSKVGDTSKKIPYSVKWNTTSGTFGNSALTTNVASGNKSGANTVSTGCSSGPSNTANFQVTFSEIDLLGAVAGTFTGVLSFTISAPT